MVRLPLGRLPLQDPPGHQLALLLDHRFHGGGTERADQLVLEVGLAGEEPQLLEASPVRDGAASTPLETSAEVALLGGVVQPGEAWLPPGRVQVLEEATHVGRPGEVHDLDHLLVEVPPQAGGEGQQRDPVAVSLDEDESPG